MNTQRKKGIVLLAGLAIIVTVITTGGMSWLLYRQTVDLLTNTLQKKLVAIARTAVAEIDAKDVEALQVEQDYQKPEWARVVNQMKKMREGNEDIIYMYIFRKSPDDPTKMVFVADSHSLNPYVNVDKDPSNDIDLNRDGVIDDADQLQWPGQSYPEPPPETFDAYNGPTANTELYTDQWGSYLSGYAPIRDDNGNVIAVLAADVRAEDFAAITTQTLTPFIAYVVGLLLVILALAIALIKIWDRQVKLVLELDRQKDELLGIVGHQIKSPISSIRWSLKAFMQDDYGPMTEEQKSHMNNNFINIKGVLNLVNLLLEAARVDMGKMKMEKEKQSLSKFFGELVPPIEELAKEKDVEFNAKIPLHLPEGTFDERLTHMTVENLLTNAVKYTPAKGRVTLEVRLDGNTLSCTIEDTGIGIPKKDQEQLFGKAFRASNVKNIEGNGLGLFVAKAAIEQQGGSLTFESEEGKGTKFIIRLPIE